MAGDWIPMRVGLEKAMEVVVIARETGRTRPEVIGYLYLLWCWVTDESRDGHARSVTFSDMVVTLGADEEFWMAVERAGWLRMTATGFEIPNWDRWNARSAKNRLQAILRKRKQREERKEGRQNVTQMSRSQRDKSVTTEDRGQRTEEKMMEDGSERPEARLSEPASPPFPPPPSPAVSIPTDLTGLELYEIDGNLCRRWGELRKAWEAAYPAVDILAEVKRAHAWEVSHPRQRKINRPKYLGDWLAREQDRGGRRGGSGDPLGRRSSFAEEGKFSDARFK